MSEPAILVKGLRRTFGKFKAVDRVSFKVEQGEIFGLLGPNGAGKTTTISMMTGMLPVTSGTLFVSGVDMVRRPKQARPLIGVVPQTLALYTSLTTMDNLRFFGALYGLRGETLRSRVDMALDVAGLRDRAKDIVDSYSGGMKRRLNLAVALLHQPRVLFLDEPTVGIDPQSRNAIFESVETLRSEGLTVLYTTHYMEEAERLCNRVAIMDHGRLIAMNTPEGLRRLVGEGQFTVRVDRGGLERLRGLLEESSTIREVRVQDDVMEVDAVSLQPALMFFLEMIRRSGTGISALNITETSLETVFLRLTGSRLRDE
ncbi:ATP-binding cassette domain-containing protein [Lautropia mirabilis]|jgi:daunorubicin resistance ABC transporter, ATP-binding protein